MKQYLKWIPVFLFALFLFSQVQPVQAQVNNNFWKLVSGVLRPVIDTYNILAPANLAFNGEIQPDGSTCSNGEILKKTGSNDWDCSADATGGGGSLTATTTTDVWIDGNRTDSYTADGTITKPFKTFATAFSGASSTAAGLNFYVAPATYVEGAPLTFPNKSLTVHANNATLVAASGATISSSYDIYDLNIIGSLALTDTSFTSIHQMNNGYVSGTTTISGLSSWFNMATGTGSPITILSGAQLGLASSYITNRIINYGNLNLSNSLLSITDNTNPVLDISSTTVGSTFTIAAVKLINAGTGGGINCANGATSTPNEINAVLVVVNGTNAINCGSALSAVNNYNAYNSSNGATLYASGTNLIGDSFSALTIQGSGANVPFLVSSSTGASLFTVRPNGSVAIGTTTNTSTLFVQGTSTFPTLAVLTAASSTGTTLFQVTANAQVLACSTCRLTIPQGTAPTLTTVGDIGIDTSNGGMFSFYAGGRENLNATTTKGMLIENPTASESLTFGVFDVPITITRVQCLITSSVSNVPSWTFSLPHGTSRASLADNAMTAGQACTSTTTPQTITIGGDLTLAAGEILAATSSAVSNASTTLIQVFYKYDN